MSLIDQRILIAAPAEAIWTFLSDPALMAKWNKVYKQVQVISTKATGTNARRRCVLNNGKSVVEEITAWLDNIGYEYHVVDGPFEQFRGRFRLQGMPDGTIVNWTVEYKLRGFMSGLVDATNHRGKQEDLMADSLRLLRRAVEASGARLDPEEQKRFAMQSGPSLEERAARIVPTTQQMPITSDAPVEDVSLDEEDIPNIPATSVKADTGSFVPSFAAEPEITAAIPVVDKTDTKPRPPKSIHQSELQASEEAQERPSDPAAPTVPITLVAPPPVYKPEPVTETVSVPVTPPEPARSIPPIPDTLPERIPTGPMPAVQVDAGIRDTKDVSIWDVFGVEKPSDRVTADLKAVVESIQRRANEEPDSTEAQRTEAFVAVQSVTPKRKAVRAKMAVPLRSANNRVRHQKVKLPIRSAR